ncbi:ACT domain-containing protein [Clostridium estertheticum]|uniref:ACT domain-containing protein n=1 Tax=Clostridium estertheticum TaxID=238834 RepID=UPI001C0B19CA|nr:ACT domain-containing protein [Clostridium estertheticum]MBU3186850.1 ACT domain-containing protein [Clostridium estertheticum]
MLEKILTMKLLKEKFAVCRLNKNELIVIISSISTILALKKISIFAVSTYDTDYILVKNKDINNAILALSNERYEVINQENMV